MYDAREKAIRDRQWELNAASKEAFAKGEIKRKIQGEIKVIRMLQEILKLPVNSESDFAGKSLEELQQLTAELQHQARNRRSS